MSAGALAVELRDFATAASAVYDDVAEPVRLALAGLSSALDGCGGMAGDDPGGRSWAGSYDDAAAGLLTATGTFVNGAYGLCSMLGRSGMNYAEAEAASTAGGGDTAAPVQQLPPDCTLGPPAPPPSAAGGGGGAPTGWGLVQAAVGYVWPNGHQDRLRRAAGAWRAAASELSSASCQVMRAARAFDADRLPEAGDIDRVCRGLQDRLDRLSTAHHTLAHACDGLADHLDHCHAEIRSELQWLAGESLVLQGVSHLFAIPTLGGSEVAGQSAQAGRIAVAAARIGRLIERFIALARDLRVAIEDVARTAKEIAGSLGRFVDPPLATAGVTAVGGVRAARVAGAAGRGAKDLRVMSAAEKETASVGRLAHAGEDVGRSGRPRDVIDQRARQHILDGDGVDSGGHRWPGSPGKSPFPRDWSDDQILDNVGDIVTSPETRWHVQTGGGKLYTRRGEPAVWRAWEVRDGERIRVAWEPATGHVRTAFPDASPVTGVEVG